MCSRRDNAMGANHVCERGCGKELVRLSADEREQLHATRFIGREPVDVPAPGQFRNLPITEVDCPLPLLPDEPQPSASRTPLHARVSTGQIHNRLPSAPTETGQ